MASRSVFWANDLFYQLSVPIKSYIYVKNYRESEKKGPQKLPAQEMQKTFKVLSRSAFWAVAPKGSWTYAFKNRDDFSFFTFSFSDYP